MYSSNIGIGMMNRLILYFSFDYPIYLILDLLSRGTNFAKLYFNFLNRKFNISRGFNFEESKLTISGIDSEIFGVSYCSSY